MKTKNTSLKMIITWQVLEKAKDADDKMIASVCRKLIHLDRIGKWDSEAFQLILNFSRRGLADMCLKYLASSE